MLTLNKGWVGGPEQTTLMESQCPDRTIPLRIYTRLQQMTRPVTSYKCYDTGLSSFPALYLLLLRSIRAWHCVRSNITRMMCVNYSKAWSAWEMFYENTDRNNDCTNQPRILKRTMQRMSSSYQISTGTGGYRLSSPFTPTKIYLFYSKPLYWKRQEHGNQERLHKCTGDLQPS